MTLSRVQIKTKYTPDSTKNIPVKIWSSRILLNTQDARKCLDANGNLRLMKSADMRRIVSLNEVQWAARNSGNGLYIEVEEDRETSHSLKSSRYGFMASMHSIRFTFVVHMDEATQTFWTLKFID